MAALAVFASSQWISTLLIPGSVSATEVIARTAEVPKPRRAWPRAIQYPISALPSAARQCSPISPTSVPVSAVMTEYV